MPVTNQNSTTYKPSHPWYYLCYQPILTPRQILAGINTAEYPDLMKEDIISADNKVEPDRSCALRKIRCKERRKLFKRWRNYRRGVHGLWVFRRQEDTTGPTPTCCDQVHSNMALLHNGLYNNLARLKLVNELLSRQRDLFSL